MGMYTSVLDWDIRMVDSGSELEEWLSDDKPPEYLKLMFDDDEKRRTFEKKYMRYKESVAPYILNEDWTELFSGKYIGYWYRHTIFVLRDLAQFIRGRIELVYETNDEFVRIRFTDEGIYFANGEIQFRSESRFADYFHEKPLPDKEMVMRKL